MQYGVPYGASTIAASAAAGWEEHFYNNWFVSLLIPLLVENGVFYLFAALCDKLVAAEKRSFKESGETLKELLAVEVVDWAVRCILMSLLPLALGKVAGVFWASAIADINFGLTFKNRGKLLAMVGRCCCALSNIIVKARRKALQTRLPQLEPCLQPGIEYAFA